MKQITDCVGILAAHSCMCRCSVCVWGGGGGGRLNCVNTLSLEACLIFFLLCSVFMFFVKEANGNNNNNNNNNNKTFLFLFLFHTLAFNFAFECRLLSSPACPEWFPLIDECCVVARGAGDGG